jgi:dihydroorotate dehydrogenase
VLYRALFRLILSRIPAETAHHLGFALLRLLMATPLVGALVRSWLRPRDPALRVTALGRTFDSPIGLAAGFDKDAKGVRALLGLGFGFVEVGTVTNEAQPGNEKPRMFRLTADGAVLNRLGFNNDGADVAAARLARLGRVPGVLGVNIGKTKRVAEADAIADYVATTEKVARYADYLVVNVSSPNTPGLRDLQAVEKLGPLLTAVRATLDRTVTERRVPLLVKIAPDLADEDIDAVAELALSLGLDGIVATNTTISREGLVTPAATVVALGAGGISGAPLAARSLAVLQRLRAKVGDRLVLVSVGGIATADDVVARLRAGATLVQLYTGFIYGGPLLPSRLARQAAAKVRLPA